MHLHDREVVDFLNSENTVRDGRLVGLAYDQGEEEWEVVVHLTFQVPTGTRGNSYRLSLAGNPRFSYEFSSECALEQIAFVKCIWTDEGKFYLSLDPWKESESFISDKDSGCFTSDRVTLSVSTDHHQQRLPQDRLEVWHDGSAICVIAVGSHGDPLDLSDHEVEDFIAKLQTALAEDRAEDR
jgi:hypothetical protein